MVIVTITAFMAVPASATWIYPDGATIYDYLVNTDDYNRTIYVYHRDTSGTLLKYCVYYTETHGDYDVFGDSLYGYDIIAYESNQGIGEKCHLTWASGNGEKAGYGQIGYEFYKLISKKSLTLNFTYEKHEPTTFYIKHYTVDKNGTKTLYDSSTSVYTYGNSMSIYRKYPTGYSLRSGYQSSITGTFTYDVLDIEENVDSRLYYDYHHGSHQGEMKDRKSYSESSKDYLDYCDNREIKVDFYYDLNKYTINFNANGGSGAPSAVTKYYGETVTLPTTKPTRSGYTFSGWGTYSSDTSANYQPGSNYTSNSGATLYAIWTANVPEPETYTISYNANGGSGAPSAQIKTEDVTLKLSSAKPTRAGYTFKGWSTSKTASTATYASGGYYKANASATLYAVWSKNTPATYTVSFDANGGSGAPSSQTKTYGVSLTLSSVKPVRDGYNFKGWATSSTATSASYQPGGSYTANAGVTLYAVWEKANYEFSISNLTVSESEPYRYGEITVKVRTDSWDNVNSYDNIPVELYYDGRLMSTQYVDFSAYGIANLTFTLNVGDTPGNRKIEARINWPNRSSETNTGNNSVSTSINVQDFDYEMSVDSVTMTDNYCAGETVISSFMVRNDSDYDITPDKNNTAKFTAYYYNGSQKVVIATDTWNNVVIPSGKANLVYFKWTVPSNLAGKTVYCECTINSAGFLNEENIGNNTATFSTTVTTFAESQTPNTRYESSKPSSYKEYSAPANSTDKATWTMWVYENNRFVLKSYGVQISSAAPVIEPSAECKTAVYANGKWTIRSGYGFTMSYAPTITTISGYTNPGDSAYTNVQSIYATFPEFNYATTNGNCRTLQYVNGKWQFVQNSNTVDSERIHFIPVWFADGNYTVSVTATRVWTPAGMIEATRTSNTFTIDGSIYDDYFVGN